MPFAVSIVTTRCSPAGSGSGWDVGHAPVAGSDPPDAGAAGALADGAAEAPAAGLRVAPAAPPPAAPPPLVLQAMTETRAMATTAIELALDPKRAPKTVNNFVFLSRYHFYDGLTFHRVVPGFVIQGGDPQGTGQGGPGYQFEDEKPKPEDYKEGGLAMANSGPNTNGSQFFILESDQAGVDLMKATQNQPNYSLFGKVTKGMDVVKAIIALGDASQKPRETVTIKSVTIKES